MLFVCHTTQNKVYLILNQCWVIVNWTLRSKLQGNFNQNTKFFIQENALENIVCKMAAILSRGRWVDAGNPSKHFNSNSFEILFSCSIKSVQNLEKIFEIKLMLLDKRHFARFCDSEWMFHIVVWAPGCNVIWWVPMLCNHIKLDIYNCHIYGAGRQL